MKHYLAFRVEFATSLICSHPVLNDLKADLDVFSGMRLDDINTSKFERAQWLNNTNMIYHFERYYNPDPQSKPLQVTLRSIPGTI